MGQDERRAATAHVRTFFFEIRFPLSAYRDYGKQGQIFAAVGVEPPRHSSLSLDTRLKYVPSPMSSYILRAEKRFICLVSVGLGNRNDAHKRRPFVRSPASELNSTVPSRLSRWSARYIENREAGRSSPQNCVKIKR